MILTGKLHLDREEVWISCKYLIRIHVWDFPACRPVWRTLGTMPKNHHKDTGWSGHGTASQHSSCTSLMRIWSSVPGTVSHRETRVRRRTCELSWLEVRQDSYQEEFPSCLTGKLARHATCVSVTHPYLWLLKQTSGGHHTHPIPSMLTTAVWGKSFHSPVTEEER